jgi:hypothetical protein
MALNDVLKGMPSMDFEFKDYATPQEFDFMNLHYNNRVLAVPPYSNVSLNFFLFTFTVTQQKLIFSQQRISPNCRRLTMTSKSTSTMEQRHSDSSTKAVLSWLLILVQLAVNT